MRHILLVLSAAAFVAAMILSLTLVFSSTNRAMLETSLIVSIATLVVGVGTFFVGILILRSVRKIERRAEDRMQYLREEQERLEFYREEVRSREERLEQERHERLEAQHKVDNLPRERDELRETQQESSTQNTHGERGTQGKE